MSADLRNQPVSVNYNKAYTSSNFGGRQLTFLVLYAFEDWYAGDPALSVKGNGYPGPFVDTGGYNRLWSEPGSRYEIAVNAIGTVAELFFLGEPRQAGSDGPERYPEESFVFAIAKDTRDITDNSNEGLLYTAIANAIGHEAFSIYEMQAQGDYFGGL